MRLEKIECNFNIFKPHDYKIIYYMLYTLLYMMSLFDERAFVIAQPLLSPCRENFFKTLASKKLLKTPKFKLLLIFLYL